LPQTHKTSATWGQDGSDIQKANNLMDTSSVQAAGSQEGQIREIPRWLKLLQEWKALAWTAAATLMAGLIHFFAYVVEGGERSALGIYALDKPPLSPDYVWAGVLVMATLGLQAIAVVMMGVILRGFIRVAARLLPDEVQPHKLLRAFHIITHRKEWGWVVIGVAVLASSFEMWVLKDLLRAAEGLVLKPANEAGMAWMRMSLDPEHNWHHLYEFQLAAIITILIILSWWILTKFLSNTLARTLYGMWMLIQVFVLVSSFALFYGVSLTFRPYPIVAFSGEEQVGKNILATLIGSDDKMFAFLILYKGDKPNEVPNPSKVILYMPRTEVKWMTVVGQEPLYLVAHYHDLKSSSPVTPPNPAPTPDTSNPEKPTIKTPAAPSK
jgi:hypothetical protein